MTNPMTFESHLSAALAEYADLAPIEIDARAMARGFASRELERPAASRWKGLRLRRGRMLVLVIVALLAAILALAVGARLLHPPTLLYGSFQSTGQLPPVAGMRRYVNAAAMLRDGRALVVGSFDSYRTGTETWAYLYDPASGSFASTGTVSEIRGLSTATTLADGRVLVVGGYHVDEEGLPIEPKYGELFDPRTGTFARTPGQMSTGRYGHTATLLADGRVLITGGAVFDFGNPSIYLAEAEVFDPDTGRFDVVGPMSESRVYHQATRLRDGRVLISGGAATDDTVATAAAELFDPATGRFSPTGSMATPRFWHAAATLADGRVLVAGGATSGSRPGVLPALASAELYDPGTGVFTTTHALATERMQPTATRLPDGRVFVAGGKNDFGGPRTAELFDPTTGLFLPTGGTATPHGAAWRGLLHDGSVLLLGEDDPSATGSAEVWSAFSQPIVSAPDPAKAAAQAFTAVNTSTVLRVGHTATLLGDGRVLVAGGRDAADPNGPVLRSAEIVDPATGRATAVGDMAVPRADHVAVLLRDGRVLLTGGEDLPCENRDCPGTASAEIFDPGSRQFTTVAPAIGIP